MVLFVFQRMDNFSFGSDCLVMSSQASNVCKDGESTTSLSSSSNVDNPCTILVGN